MTYNDVEMLIKQASYFAKKLADGGGELSPEQHKHYEEQLNGHLGVALKYANSLRRG